MLTVSHRGSILIACNVKHAQCYADILHKFCSYQVLNQVTPNPKGVNCDAAVKNKALNRSMDYLPGETLHVIPPCVPCMNKSSSWCIHTANKHRVILKQGHPDYIHASFVNVSYVIS